MNSFIKDTIEKIPYSESFIEDLKACQQDKEWHAEGDVFTHTQMVLDEMEKIISSESLLTEQEENILRYAALFHDIAKPKCYSEENGKIRAHNHTRVGSMIATEILYHSNLSFNEIYNIVKLIRLHGKPTWLIDSKTPAEEVVKYSHVINNEMLYHLCMADNSGRICSDKEENFFKLEYFKETAQNNFCFLNEFYFDSDHSKYCHFVKKTHHFMQSAFDDTKSNVYLMVGLPGSGKDYYINKNLSNIPQISLDKIRKELKIKPTDEQGKVSQLAKERAKEFLRRGQDFVWNSTNTTRNTRDQIISMFDNYRAKIHIVFIYKPINEILKQNSERDAQVPKDIIYKLLKKLEIPTGVECHTIEYIS